ncbi:hypothetical protein AB3464_06000 [Pseudomonas asplenii]|uniref:hypothetical protein n=1 Tax=Pseudomonas asplenii TaxID=53407 RepID=UPI0037C5BC47
MNFALPSAAKVVTKPVRYAVEQEFTSPDAKVIGGIKTGLKGNSGRNRPTSQLSSMGSRYRLPHLKRYPSPFQSTTAGQPAKTNGSTPRGSIFSRDPKLQ